MIPRRVIAAIVAALLPAMLVAQTVPATPLRLVRCAPRADVACLQTRVTLDAAGATAARTLDSATESRAWTGVLAGSRLLGPGVTLSRAIVPPLRLIVLVDLSGSMRGTSIAYVRTAIRSDLLNNLDSTSVRVAIAGFESHHVVAGIDSVSFRTPTDANVALARLGDPVPDGNTGLYSAIVAAGARLATELRATPGAQGAILLVTDGGNDVRGSSDPGLLDGESGLQQAIDAARGPGRGIWILGVGHSIAADVLRRIAGTNFVATEATPVEIGRQLDGIVREFRGARDLTFGAAGGDADALARAAWRGTAALFVADSAVVSRELSWRPPYFAMPAYEGVADSAALTPVLRETLSGAVRATGVHWMIAAAFALIGVLFGTLVPRLAWIGDASPEDAAPPAAVPERPKMVVARAAAVPAPVPFAGGLRRDVTESAPRRGDDVTNQAARPGVA
jgi:von Willebrand factor type A domain-containing protein